MGGRLGRRYPTLGPAPGGPAQRQHLDQRYLGWVVTAVWRRGLHALTARYDVMDYNAGNAWYGTTSPYRTATADLTPRFTEMVLGWNRFLAGEARWRTVHAKLNLVRRTGPVLLPAAGASGARAGNSLVAVLQVGF